MIAHELAHRLHIRLVHGAEEKMGPIWFFEGLATYAACQFDEDTTSLSRKEVEEILAETGRGDYRKYNRAVKFFLSLVPLAELVRRAAGRNFQEWLLKNAAPQSAQ
ncbi:hypothetical protein IV102_09265 [bacterium]|nr:hypothetical protein [bacterium]